MKLPYRRYLPEQVLYAVIWLIVFLTPVIGYVFILFSGDKDEFNWTEVFRIWQRMLPFLLIFLINNYLLAPFLLFRKRYVSYVGSILLLIVIVCGLYASLFHRPPWANPTRMYEINKEAHERMKEYDQPFMPPPRQHPDSGKVPPPVRDKRPHMPPMDQPIPFRYALLFMNSLMAVLLIGFNTAVKLFFKSIRDEETMRELERHQLQTELEYLKYQISPHFFMNTLNNIHALMDVDVEKSKKTIIELSKMMRYLLYESSHQHVMLLKEVQFLRNYIHLMKIRYTEKVQIETSLPVEIPEIRIPPLLFISFVENAFKHGVSYRAFSRISVSLRVEDENIVFHCINTSWERSEEQHKGIGLDNICKRLRLLYGSNYTLSIQENNGNFEVLLIIPIQS